MAESFQVQKSRDGKTWTPMQPADPAQGLGEHGLTHGGDHWYVDHHKAWVAANQLRNNFMWSSVRIVHRDEDGTITREQTIL